MFDSSNPPNLVEDLKKIWERAITPEYNCLTWARDRLKDAGIVLPPIDTVLAVPDEYIKRIASNPSLVRLTG
jgi:hypothetical protein